MSRLVYGRRREVLEAVFDALMSEPAERALAEAHRFTRRDFCDAFAQTATVGIERAGVIVGGMIFYGQYVHLGVLSEHRMVWMRHFRAMLEYGFSQGGPRLIARVYLSNTKSQSFVERVGCVEARRTAHFVEYQVCKERMRYGRNRQHAVQ